MERLNILLFSTINASDGAPGIVIAVARISAQWLVYLSILMIVALWVWAAPSRRGALLATGLSLGLGLGLNQAVGLLWFHPRPFMLGLGRTLIAHVSENSFPSDHATFVWSLAFGLIFTGASWRLGWLLAIGGCIVAWARIYMGLHFPFDMVGSLLISLLAAMVARVLRPFTERQALPLVETTYEAALGWLHLPQAIFPRRGK
jgi:undecaprenyl-diphosphatase